VCAPESSRTTSSRGAPRLDKRFRRFRRFKRFKRFKRFRKLRDSQSQAVPEVREARVHDLSSKPRNRVNLMRRARSS
jgi:hypothetical protein